MGMDTDAAIEDLVRAFKSCTLPRARWTHQAHLAVGLWFLRRLPRKEATQVLRTSIQHYNRAIGGNPEGYHETITLGWIAIIVRFLREHDRGQPQAELTRLLIDCCGDKDYLLRYWSSTLLGSEAARTGWVAPDLQPLE